MRPSDLSSFKIALGSSGKPIDWSEIVPEFRDFHISAHLGGRGQPGGQPDENRLWQGSLGTVLAERGASTIQRSTQNRFGLACNPVRLAPLLFVVNDVNP